MRIFIFVCVCAFMCIKQYELFIIYNLSGKCFYLFLLRIVAIMNRIVTPAWGYCTVEKKKTTQIST